MSITEVQDHEIDEDVLATALAWLVVDRAAEPLARLKHLVPHREIPQRAALMRLVRRAYELGHDDPEDALTYQKVQAIIGFLGIAAEEVLE